MSAIKNEILEVIQAGRKDQGCYPDPECSPDIPDDCSPWGPEFKLKSKTSTQGLFKKLPNQNSSSPDFSDNSLEGEGSYPLTLDCYPSPDCSPNCYPDCYPHGDCDPYCAPGDLSMREDQYELNMDDCSPNTCNAEIKITLKS